MGVTSRVTPIGLRGGNNTYGYAGGAPLRNFDARGLDNPSMGPLSVAKFELAFNIIFRKSCLQCGADLEKARWYSIAICSIPCQGGCSTQD